MSSNIKHFIGYLPEDNRKIIGLTDQSNFTFLPLLINFNIFSLNIINSILNEFDTYGLMFDPEDKAIIEDLANPGFNKKIEHINISTSDSFRFFSVEIINYINSMKIEDKEYIFFIPCNIDFLWEIEKNDLNQDFYKINFQNNESIGFVLKTCFLKQILQKYNIQHFNQLYDLISKSNKNLIETKVKYLFSINNLKEYLDFHLKLFQNPNIFIFLNHLMHNFSKVGEIVISKEADILNSYIGYNSLIKGKIEDSIIFNDVIILQDTHIQNSIILPGNVIAKGVKIKNTIIGTNKNPMKDITIGPATTIGYSSHQNLKNALYNKEIPEGYTLIGNDILLPGGINIGKNCVIRGNINISELKKMKTLIDGGTFESVDNT